MNSGVYIAVFHLARTRNVGVGRLGWFEFRPGFYLYVGSAQRALTCRLERHARKRKPLHWHTDYLSAKARMLGAIILLEQPRRCECELARELGRGYEMAVPGFGASDCRCGGHLLYAPALP